MSTRILVLNCFVKGWNVLKALADDGFEVNGADYRPHAPGLFSSRITDRSRNFIYHNPSTDENLFVNEVIDFIARTDFDLILPVNAAEMMALARRRDEIAKHVRFPFEEYHKLLLLHDKKYFFELLGAHVDSQVLPRTWSVGDRTPAVADIIKQAGLDNVAFLPMDNHPSIEHFINAHEGILYPLIVKTRRATSARGVYRVADEQELRAACKALGGIDMIIQENLVGRGVGISSIRWDSPALTTHFGHKRVREYPVSGGASTSREPWDCDHHPLIGTITGFLDKLDWHGVVMFELKELTSEENQFSYRFLEANPRFWGSVPLAIANGVNFPVLLCRAALGMDIPPVVNRKTVRARILFSDTLSLVLNLLKGRRIGYHLKDYFNFRSLYLDDVDFKDRRATLKACRLMLRELFARLTGKR